jgi:hypothetical protein
VRLSIGGVREIEMFWKKPKWSEIPGCFERHLQRKNGNLLFPLERRTVSKEEIAEARRKDEIDQDKFIEKVRKLGAELENMEDTCPLSTLQGASSLQIFHALLEEAASIGGNIQSAIHSLETTEQKIIQWLKTSFPEMKEELERWKSLSMTARIPFMAQLKRKDTPILEDEQVPALLSEDFATIAVIGFASRSLPNFKPSEADLRKYLDAAIRQGFPKERAQEIMNAWNQIQ